MKTNQFNEKTIQIPIQSGFGFFTTAKQVIGDCNLKGKIVIVTGGYSGIGLETSRLLAEAGATVIVPARNIEKAKMAVAGIPNVELDVLDLMDPESINGFAQRFLTSGRPLHILINCGGIMAAPLIRDERGYESHFSTNHLGHFQLTARLWAALKQAKDARVVSVSARAHRLGSVDMEDPNFEKREYDKWIAYAQSKSANVLFAVELDRLGRSYGVRAFAPHPGIIPDTDLHRYVSKEEDAPKQPAPDKKADQFKTIEQGAATVIWCAISAQLDEMGGVYCEDVDISEAVPAESLKGTGVRPWAINQDLAKKLWQLSEDLTGVKFII